MMLAHLKQQLHQHFPNQIDFLIALSGGVDSVVLLYLFSQLDLKVRAIHVHHGLSANADRWVTFCQQLCESWQIPLTVKYVQVSGKNGIEASAREARYQAIQETIFAKEVLVTAHHLNDQVETFFLALKRGAGLKGLSAMQAVNFSQKFTLFRPLLEVAKADILAYAQTHSLQWVEDESNQSNDYERNFLRNEMLPQFTQKWGHFNQQVAKACQHLANEQRLLDELLNDTFERYFNSEENTLNVVEFSQFSEAKQTALIRLWLSKCQLLMPSQAQLTQLLQSVIFANADKNPSLRLEEHIIRRYQSTLFITKNLPAISTFEVQIQQGQRLELPASLGEVSYLKQEIICKTEEKIYRLQVPAGCQNLPLTLRLGYSGKVMEYGKSHHETIKKIWQKHQVPVWLRDRTPLVFCENYLLGVLF